MWCLLSGFRTVVTCICIVVINYAECGTCALFYGSSTCEVIDISRPNETKLKIERNILYFKEDSDICGLLANM